jgi:hypothetical protein
MQAPLNLTEDEVKTASQGKSEEVMGQVMGQRKPLDLTEDEVKAASQGRSEEIMSAKMTKSNQT